MRIDLVITELDTGGAERCCVSLACFLQSRGHRVRVIAFGPRPAPPKAALLNLLEQRAIETHFLDAQRWWMLPKVARRFRRLLRSDPPELVQSFLWHANVLSAWIVPSFGIPVVGGARVAEPNRNRHALGGWAARRMAKVVCVSNSVKQWCISAERVLPAKLEVIPNGIEIATQPAAIHLSEFGIAEDARILLFVGRLTVQKGVDELLDRAPKLLKSLPSHQLVLLGDGPLRARADATSNLPEIKGRMKVLGQSNAVRAWMGRSEMLLLPTRYEGMPNVVLEAMAEGLPVVTTRVEGVVDLLGDSQEMQAVEAGDWDRWLDQVVHVANDSELRDGLGRFNRARAETEFCLEIQMEKYENLYQHVLETCRSGRM